MLAAHPWGKTNAQAIIVGKYFRYSCHVFVWYVLVIIQEAETCTFPEGLFLKVPNTKIAFLGLYVEYHTAHLAPTSVLKSTSLIFPFHQDLGESKGKTTQSPCSISKQTHRSLGSYSSSVGAGRAATPRQGAARYPQRSAPGSSDLCQLQRWQATPHLPCTT